MKRDEGLEGESAGDELAQQAKEDERRMKFSFAVAEMIAMESHTKQLLLQVGRLKTGFGGLIDLLCLSLDTTVNLSKHSSYFTIFLVHG